MVNVSHFYGGKDFKQAILGAAQFRLVLADFELLRETQSGLDLILELGIEKISVLVTSRFEDESVRAVCESKKIKLLPKALASQVPVKVEEGNLKEFVLLDNDPLVHQLWSLSAKRAGVRLHSFFNVEDFFAEVNRFQKDTPISVDFHLDESMNGLQVCEKLRGQGFSDLTLVTGTRIDDCPWWLRVREKKANFRKTSIQNPSVYLRLHLQMSPVAFLTIRFGNNTYDSIRRCCSKAPLIRTQPNGV